MLRLAALLLLLLVTTPAWAQTAGGSCSGSITAGPDANGNNLICSGGIWTVVTNSSSIATASDVTLSSVANNDILQYSSGTSKWVNTQLSSAISAATAPSFSVRQSSSQTITAGGGAITLTWGTEDFDTNNNFSSNTFTPTIAGKYILSLVVAPNAFGTCSAAAGVTFGIRKNGTIVTYNTILGNGTYANGSSPITVVVSANGTTDYFDAYAIDTCAGSFITYTGPSGTVFSGSLLAPLASGSVAGTGGAGYVPYWTSSTNIGSDQTSGGQFYWDSTNHRLGLGTISPAYQLDVTSSATTGTALGVTANSVTSGGAVSVASSATALTGDLVSFVGSGSNAANTGNVLKVGQTGTLSTGTALNVTNGGASTSVSFRVNDDGTYTDSTPFLVDASGNVGIGTAAPGQKLSVVGTVESTSGGFKFPDATTQTTKAMSSCTTVSTAFSANTTGTATCSSGYTMTGGGYNCACANGCMAAYNYPSGNAWVAGYCYYVGGTAYGGTVYARCCQ